MQIEKFHREIRTVGFMSLFAITWIRYYVLKGTNILSIYFFITFLFICFIKYYGKNNNANKIHSLYKNKDPILLKK